MRAGRLHTLYPAHGLADVRPDAPAARILRALTAANLVLGCTPIVNLFQHPATPIRITHASSSYPLMPDELPGNACDIYSIDSVQLVSKARDGSAVTEFFPTTRCATVMAASAKAVTGWPTATS
jgi:type VI protein secretion system component VasA